MPALAGDFNENKEKYPIYVTYVSKYTFNKLKIKV